uniref:Uncharacterized protein n=1 Tax=Rhizophora mucronata TaxID=61149 RepID=A0A2P2MHM4_RHIMU
MPLGFQVSSLSVSLYLCVSLFTCRLMCFDLNRI